jgi:shikimate kinase
MIQLIGPGGAGKSTIGALLAERLDVIFVDLDRHLTGRVGDISEYISRYGTIRTRERMSRRTARCAANTTVLESLRYLPAS